MRKISAICTICTLLILSSCGTRRNLVYFSDITDSTATTTSIKNMPVVRIQKGDIISVNVSSLNPESNVLFNSGAIQEVDGRNALLGSNAGNSGINTNSKLNSAGYEIDSKGDINFPVVGKISLEGLSREEASDKLTKILAEHVKQPIVNVNFLNFKVTVLGEVNRPSTFTIPNDRINVLEALGMAGDMTMYGRRENILLIREKKGQRTLVRLNLNKSSSINSEYFMLQQNDVVYVEPDKMKERQASTNVKTISLLASFTTVLVVAISRLF